MFLSEVVCISDVLLLAIIWDQCILLGLIGGSVTDSRCVTVLADRLDTLLERTYKTNHHKLQNESHSRLITILNGRYFGKFCIQLLIILKNCKLVP
jgi:hypothetical protein